MMYVILCQQIAIVMSISLFTVIKLKLNFTVKHNSIKSQLKKSTT
jgi:hypothetical protein